VESAQNTLQKRLNIKNKTMRNILIQGGAELSGEVTISGAKNAALPILAATLLTNEINVLKNVPNVKDIDTMLKLFKYMGVEVQRKASEIKVSVPKIIEPVVPYELVKTMRASVLTLGPLIARFGKARVSLPGGCAIGARPIDLHLKGLSLMGADIEIVHGYITASSKRLKGKEIYLDIPTVTGTENLMMAAALAEGETVIINAAREPEVQDLALFLNKMGAEIKGQGSSIIRIKGKQTLKGAEHTIIPDRIEAGTFMIASALCGKDVLIKEINLSHLGAVINKLQEAGINLEEETKKIRIREPKQKRESSSVNICTAPYPGFPTDMQAQFMVLMCLSKGQSTITETIFENRFMHISELKRMGAMIEKKGRTAVIKGVSQLTGTKVMATDLRASACLILAGLVAKGTTEILRTYHLDRGYEDIVGKLKRLGANIQTIPGKP
jgi:UDP-N-acetylglucosamine 1-carboxyvinyltransferase